MSIQPEMLAPPTVIVALDYPEANTALQLVAQLDPQQCRLKVGNELFTRAGPTLVEELIRRGFDVFLDLKYHDIPNTVAAACHAAADLGVWMLNVHAGGGQRMLDAAREAVAQHGAGGGPRPIVIGVTVLTSFDASAMAEVGLSCQPAEQALRLAELCAAAGLDGVVCSAQEATLLRERLGDEFIKVTPGIRPHSTSSNADDQRRTLDPASAVRAGAHYLVVGRPITRADDPLAALQDISANASASVEPSG